MIYRACVDFGCDPWELSEKRLAQWNRTHGRFSGSRRVKRQHELRLRIRRELRMQMLEEMR
jgi:hypothetical protein